MYIKTQSNKLLSPIILKDTSLYDLGINRFSSLAIEFKFVKVYFPTSGEPEDETGMISLEGRSEIP